jgi:hypothetical protein
MHPRFFHDPSRRRVVLAAFAAGAGLVGASAVRAQG